MIEVCAIASGSNGNCYYIGNEKDAILVDVGISRKQVLLRMTESGLDSSKVRALFITHEHGDHCRGVRVLAKTLRIPVYMTKGTYEQMSVMNRSEHYCPIKHETSIQIGNIQVIPFLKNHDGAEPFSFRVKINEYHIGVFTDIGAVCENLIQHFKPCHTVFLETNYDEDTLANGPYPYHLKQRIQSDVGHLSNLQAFDFVNNHAGEKLSHILLSHLSGENNTREIAYDTFREMKDRYQITVTSRHEASEVYTIE